MIKVINVKVIFILFLVFFISCNNNRKTYYLNEIDFDINKLEDNYKTILNFNLRDSSFVKDLETKIKRNLCDNPNIVIKLTTKDLELVIPSLILSQCPNMFRCGKNIISYSINDKNEVLVDYEHFLKSDENSSLKVAESIYNYKEENQKKFIPISFNWNNSNNSKQTKKRFKELINGIVKYRNKTSIKLFGKTLGSLTKKEKEILLKTSNLMLIIISYDFPMPPPPPPDIENFDLIK